MTRKSILSVNQYTMKMITSQDDFNNDKYNDLIEFECEFCHKIYTRIAKPYLDIIINLINLKIGGPTGLG